MLKETLMRASLLTIAGLGVVGCGSSEEAPAGEPTGIERTTESAGSKMWVSTERIDRHTCASAACGVVGTLDFREAVDVHERKGDWIRVSKLYDASCINGRSEYVDKGNAACVSD